VKGDDTQKKLDALIRRYKPGFAQGMETVGNISLGNVERGTLEDQEVLDKCRSAKNAAKFEGLFNYGDVATHHDGDVSRADLALMSMMAFYTQDPEQLERLFSASVLGQREKWQRRADYRRMTIEKALSQVRETYNGAEALELGGHHSPNGSKAYNAESNRLIVSSSPCVGVSDDDDTISDSLGSPQIVWFHELGEPKPRRFIIEKVGRKGYPLVVYGAGGVAKSFAVLAGGIAIAGGHREWMGLRVLEHGHVLYLDFELDVDEQHKRVVELCNGLGVLVPKRLAYLSGKGFSRDNIFAKARQFAKTHNAVAIIIDSVGQAMVGDMDRNRDVNAFYRDYIEPFSPLNAWCEF